MVDIARSPEVIRKKKIRRIIYGAVALIAIVVITVGVSRLKPAAPSVDRATVWVDTVKRGPMLRQVRGSGTLVPEEHPLDLRDHGWPRRTSGPARRRSVKPNTVIIEMSNPDLEQAVMRCAAGLPVGASRLREPQGGPPERAAHAGSRRRDDRSQLQPGERSQLEANQELDKDEAWSRSCR